MKNALKIGDKVNAPDNGPGTVQLIEKDRYLVLYESGGRNWVTQADLDLWERQEEEARKRAETPRRTPKLAAVAALIIATMTLLVPKSTAQPSTTGYVSAQDLSSSTNWAEVVFPGAASKQIVLKALDVQSDAATNETWIIGGTRPLAIQYSLNNTQLVVVANTNVITNQFAIIQMNGATNQFVVNILYTNQLTNIVVGGPGSVLAALSTATLGSLTNTNGILWLCTNRFKIWPGVGTLSRSGESLFSAQVRAPLAIRTGSPSGPAGGASNQVRNATVLYQLQ